MIYHEDYEAMCLFRNTQRVTGRALAYHTWQEVSRGLMTNPTGPNLKEELQWDTTTTFTLNI